jgi:bacteriocin-like protein
MVDDKQALNPGESPEVTAEQEQLTEKALEKVSGGTIVEYIPPNKY